MMRGRHSRPGSSRPDEARTASLQGRLWRFAVGLGLRETTLSRLVLASGEDELVRRKRQVVAAFLEGCRAALEEDRLGTLARRLGAVALELRGFAFEGTGLGLTLRDVFAARRRLFREFVTGDGSGHAYMMHVGAGFALGRSPLPAAVQLARLEPLLRWAAWDGQGFYQGLARRALRVGQCAPPRRLAGQALRSFDVGLGRSLWFTLGAEVAPIAAKVAAFPAGRRADLWSGLGIASSYTGWVETARLAALRLATGPYYPDLCQGVTVSAWARLRAANPTPETEAACRALCGMGAERAAEVAEEALSGLPPDDASGLAFETWRRRVRSRFAADLGRVGAAAAPQRRGTPA